MGKKYEITITFSADRDLSDQELADMLNACVVQVEEPQAESYDPTVIGPVDADFTTKILAAKVRQ